VREINRLIVLFALGFCTIPAQIILMREFLLVFGGNELIIGLFLATWMLLTSAGSYAARFMRIRNAHIPYYVICLAWLPVFLLYMIDLLRNRIFLPGIEPGLLPVLLSTFLLLLPFCFISGLLFSNIAEYLTRSAHSDMSDKAYGLESAGSMCGGILFSLFLVYLYDDFRSAAIVAFLSSALVLLFRRNRPGKPGMVVLFILLSLILIIVCAAGSRFPRHFLFKDQDLLEILDTPFGNLAVTRTPGQLNFFENNTLLFSTDNQLTSEEAVHFAMLQHPSPRHVLLVSGGIAGLTKEILKYQSVETLDYIEIDPIILELGKKYTPFLRNKKIFPVSDDPRLFLRRTDRMYDVVIVFLPPPSSFQINRFYTAEFMTAVKKRMNHRGIFTFSLPLTGFYLNTGTSEMYSSLLAACSSVFGNVRLFPGQNCYFVASDCNIKTNISQLIECKSINTDYVNSYYIDEAEMIRNSKILLKQLPHGIKINTDFRPIAVSGFYQYWVNRFRMEFNSFRLFAILAAAAIILGLTIASPAYSGMFAAGFTASALQVILILAFQIVCGYVYRSIGLFTAAFMTGLTMGAIFRRRFLPFAAGGLVYLQLILAGLSVLVPWMIHVSVGLNHHPVMVHLPFLMMIGLISVTTGIIFSLSVQASGKEAGGNISGIYGADLAGASLGAFLTILLLIPVAGIKYAPYLTGSINLMVACILLIRRIATNPSEN
jgi:spermidine synthase